MSGSWKPLKTDPGAGAGRLRPASAGLRLRPPEPAPPPGPSAPRLTFLHLPGELVQLQQGRHAGARVLPQNGLHGHAPGAQAEVEVSEPEHPVEARGDVRWGASQNTREPRLPLEPRL